MSENKVKSEFSYKKFYEYLSFTYAIVGAVGLILSMFGLFKNNILGLTTTTATTMMSAGGFGMVISMILVFFAAMNDIEERNQKANQYYYDLCRIIREKQAVGLQELLNLYRSNHPEPEPDVKSIGLKYLRSSDQIGLVYVWKGENPEVPRE